MVHIDGICTLVKQCISHNFVIVWVIVEDYTTFRCSKYFITENLPSNSNCYPTFFYHIIGEFALVG